jgi:hypothetical protein
MPKHDPALIRQSFSRQGLDGPELDAAVLAYNIANSSALDKTADAEAMSEMKQLIAEYVRDTSTKDTRGA